MKSKDYYLIPNSTSLNGCTFPCGAPFGLCGVPCLDIFCILYFLDIYVLLTIRPYGIKKQKLTFLSSDTFATEHLKLLN